VTAAEAAGVVRYVASAVWCLGQTYAQLGDHHSSFNHLQEAYRLFNTLPPSEVESQRLGGLCGIDLLDTARLAFEIVDYDQVVSLAQDVETKCAALSDDVIHGRCLVTLGALHRDHQPDEALRCLDQAQTMLKAAQNNYNLAEAYQVISWLHFDASRLPEAMDTIEAAWKHAQLAENASVQADISLDFGRTLVAANKDQEAWKYFEITLMKASYIGNRVRVAEVLECMGSGYLRRRDYQNAYGAYEAAAEKYLGTAVSFGHERCLDNMDRIKCKEENPDMVIGFRRHYLDIADTDIDETLFYLPVQAFASDEPISSS